MNKLTQFFKRFFIWISGHFSERDFPESQRSRFYGGTGTIHSTTHLDVETYKGEVVSVWFRCQMLPFEQHHVDIRRGHDMRNAQLPELTGVELRDNAGATTWSKR